MISPPKPRGRPPKDPVKLAIYNAACKGKHLSVADAQKLVLGSGAAGATMEVDVVAAPTETSEQIVARIASRFDVLMKIVKGACEGNVRAVIVSGAGGVGKTFTVEEILSYYAEKYAKQTKIVRGVVSPIALYMLLYKYRSADSVLVLDDADAIFSYEDSLSILKAALDSSPVREISWMSESHALKQEDVPNSFLYEGTMIFITNINMQQYVDAPSKTKLSPHMQALMTRALYLDLKLHTEAELMAWISHITLKKHILVQHGLNHDEEKTVLKWLESNQGRLRELSLRTAIKVAQTMNMEPTKWKAMAETLLCR